jgi:hypothetical protein
MTLRKRFHIPPTSAIVGIAPSKKMKGGLEKRPIREDGGVLQPAYYAFLAA